MVQYPDIFCLQRLKKVAHVPNLWVVKCKKFTVHQENFCCCCLAYIGIRAALAVEDTTLNIWLYVICLLGHICQSWARGDKPN